MKRFAARALCLITLAIAPSNLAWGQDDPPKTLDDLPLLQSDPLPEGAVHRFGTTRLRLPITAGYLIFSPDDSVLMVGCNNEVRFWETKTWREIWRLESLAFSCSPDGKHIARQTADRNIEIWNVEKKTKVKTIQPAQLNRTAPVFDIEFNQKGDGLWLGMSGQGLWLYNWAKGEVVNRINVPDVFEGSLCISRDRKVIALQRHTDRISIYDATAGTLIREIIGVRGDTQALSHDGKFIASHNSFGQIKIWYTATGRSVSFLPDIPKKPNPKGERDDDIPEEQPFFGSLLFDAKGERLVFTGRLMVIDRKAKKVIAEDPPGSRTGITGAISNNNEIVAVSCADGSVDVRRLDSLKPVVKDTFPRGGAISTTFSHDGKSLAILNASDDAEVRLWQLSDYSEQKRFAVDTFVQQYRDYRGEFGIFGPYAGNSRSQLQTSRLAFLPGDQRLFLGNSIAWNVATGGRVKLPTTSNTSRLIRASADSRRWLLANVNQIQDVLDLSLFDPKAKKDLIKFPLETSPETSYSTHNTFGALSLDGGVVALQMRPASQRDPNSGEMPFREGSIVVWNTRGDKPKRMISLAFEQSPRGFEVSADGRFFGLQGGPSATLPHRLWHLSTGLPLWKIEMDDHPNPLKKTDVKPTLPDVPDAFLDDFAVEFDESPEGWLMAFSPDGQFLAESSDHGVAIRETLSGARLLTFPTGDGSVCDIAFSPDSRLIATASRDSTVTLWKVPPFAGAPEGNWNRELVSKNWDVLRGEALRAFKAMADFRAGGDDAVASLKPFVKSEIADDRQQVLDALRDLNSPAFVVREKATGRLERWGYRLKPFLAEAISKATDLEQKRRLTALHERYKNGGIDPNELRLARCVYVLERIGTPMALELLEQIAAGHSIDMTAEAARAALARLRK